MGLDVILEVELGETPEREFVKKRKRKKNGSQKHENIVDIDLLVKCNKMQSRLD